MVADGGKPGLGEADSAPTLAPAATAGPAMKYALIALVGTTFAYVLYKKVTSKGGSSSSSSSSVPLPPWKSDAESKRLAVLRHGAAALIEHDPSNRPALLNLGGGICVSREIASGIERGVLPGTGLTPRRFWLAVARVVRAARPSAEAALSARAEAQERLDRFFVQQRRSVLCNARAGLSWHFGPNAEAEIRGSGGRGAAAASAASVAVMDSHEAEVKEVYGFGEDDEERKVHSSSSPPSSFSSFSSSSTSASGVAPPPLDKEISGIAAPQVSASLSDPRSCLAAANSRWQSLAHAEYSRLRDAERAKVRGGGYDDQDQDQDQDEQEDEDQDEGEQEDEGFVMGLADAALRNVCSQFLDRVFPLEHPDPTRAGDEVSHANVVAYEVERVAVELPWSESNNNSSSNGKKMKAVWRLVAMHSRCAPSLCLSLSVSVCMSQPTHTHVTHTHTSHTHTHTRHTHTRHTQERRRWEEHQPSPRPPIPSTVPRLSRRGGRRRRRRPRKRHGGERSCGAVSTRRSSGSSSSSSSSSTRISGRNWRWCVCCCWRG